MKKTHLIFFAHDAEAAKAVAAKIRDTTDPAFLRDVSAFDGSDDPCDRVIIMPDVSEYMRGKINAVYGSKVDKSVAGIIEIKEAQEQSATIAGSGEVSTVVVNADTYAVPEKQIKHRGHGRFYVMRGDDILSGPHTKAEAESHLSTL